MTQVAPVVADRRRAVPENYDQLSLYERLYCQRSDVPAITHVAFSARIQSVHRDTNPRFWQLIKTFKTQTGFGLLINTSFNVRGEPIVCTPADAYLCFMRTKMDYLVMDHFLFDKKDQPALQNDENWQERYELD